MAKQMTANPNFPYIHPVTQFLLSEYFIRSVANDRALYPIALAAFDIAHLQELNQTDGYNVGNNAIFDLSHVMRHCAPDQTIFIHDDDAVLIIACPKQHEVDIKSIAELIQKEYEHVEYGLSEAEGPLMISAAIDDAKESARIHQMLSGKGRKSESLTLLMRWVESVDKETKAHMERVQSVSLILGSKIELSHLDMARLSLASLLHDIGKVLINKDILQKTGKLTDEEWILIKQHPEYSESLVKDLTYIKSIAPLIRAHHERWDGNGYPDGVAANSIDLLTRIITVADAYDVMTYGRQYKKPMQKENVIKEFLACAGDQFDPYVVRVLVQLLYRNEL